RLGRRTGGAERHSERFGKRDRLVDVRRFPLAKPLIESLIWPSMTDRAFAEEDRPLKIDFLDADFGCDFDEFRQLFDRFAQSCEPGRDAWLLVSFTLLQGAKGANIPQDTVEVVLAADRPIGFGIGGIKRDAQLVQLRCDER